MLHGPLVYASYSVLKAVTLRSPYSDRFPAHEELMPPAELHRMPERYAASMLEPAEPNVALKLDAIPHVGSPALCVLNHCATGS